MRGLRELLSLYRKNYVAAGIVFMLHNYATRDRSDRDHHGKGGGSDADAREVEKKRAAGRGKVFRRLVGPTEANNAIRLMNRNNSHAIVLFGSFQLTAAASVLYRTKLRCEPNRAKPSRNRRDAWHCFKFLCRAPRLVIVIFCQVEG